MKMMKMNKKVSLRRCTFCGSMVDKRDMIRVIKTKENEVSLDLTGKKNGRGAYICCSSECLKNAINNKGLERTLKTSIPKEVFVELEKELSETDIK